MKTIKLTQDQETVISTKDYKYLIQWKWCALKVTRTGKFYAVRGQMINGKVNTIYMHRVIAERMGLDLSHDIDHIDRNSLNNLRGNLRIASRLETCRNKSKQSNNTSGYTGVSFYKPSKKWRAYIVINRKQIHLGYFDNVIHAAKAFNDAAIKYFGKFAVLNFPGELNVNI